MKGRNQIEKKKKWQTCNLNNKKQVNLYGLDNKIEINW